MTDLHRPPQPRRRRVALARARLPIDDTRISEIMELAPPAHLLREFPASERAATTTYEARQAIHRVLHGADDRLLVVVGPCSIHDYDAAIDYATRLAALQARARRRPHRRDARLFREAAHDGRLEGPHQRSAPRRQLPDQRGAAARAPHPARDQRARPAGRHRIPRHDHAAIHRRPDRVGRHRRAHHRKPGAPPARLGPVVPGRIQERHQRRREDRRRRDQGRVRAASLPVGHQGRPLGDRAHRGQRGLPHHPARRQDAELRRRERRGGVQGARRTRGSPRG